MSKTPIHIKMARPGEANAVRTTIVGGRPPGGGANVGDVPRGVEVLIKKAAVDPKFKKLLLEKRAGAAEAIALKLEPAEEAMLASVPLRQLKGIVANTKVRPNLRPAFLGYAAGAMLAALATVTVGCKNDGEEDYRIVKGIDPDYPPEPDTAETVGTAITADMSLAHDNRVKGDKSDYGTISGLVTDKNGTPISNVTVLVTGENRFAVTNADGRYFITPVPPGVFVIRAYSTEYGSIEQVDVNILSGLTTNLTFRYINPPIIGAEEPLIKYNTTYQGIRPDVPSERGK